MQKLDSPHIVKVVDFIDDVANSLLYIILEYVEISDRVNLPATIKELKGPGHR